MRWMLVSQHPKMTRILLTNILGTRSRLYNSTGFFFLAWATHYLPFYLMGRQLFLHHYLPAHLASTLVTGALLEFIFNVEPVIDDASYAKKKGVAPKKHLPAREKLAGQNLSIEWAAVVVIMTIVIGGWYFFLPLTYGYPGLSVEEVLRRKWLGYDLHFAK
jgi:dolichyl-phosphate-mannose-protein mannosyltransferase